MVTQQILFRHQPSLVIRQHETATQSLSRCIEAAVEDRVTSLHRARFKAFPDHSRVVLHQPDIEISTGFQVCPQTVQLSDIHLNPLGQQGKLTIRHASLGQDTGEISIFQVTSRLEQFLSGHRPRRQRREYGAQSHGIGLGKIVQAVVVEQRHPLLHTPVTVLKPAIDLRNLLENFVPVSQIEMLPRRVCFDQGPCQFIYHDQYIAAVHPEEGITLLMVPAPGKNFHCEVAEHLNDPGVRANPVQRFDQKGFQLRPGPDHHIGLFYLLFLGLGELVCVGGIIPRDQKLRFRCTFHQRRQYRRNRLDPDQHFEIRTGCRASR